MEIKAKKAVKSKATKTTPIVNEVNLKVIKHSAINCATFLIEKEKLSSEAKIEAKGVNYNGQKCTMSYALIADEKLVGVYKAFPGKKIADSRSRRWGGDISLSDDGQSLELKQFSKEDGKQVVNKAELFDLE